MEKNKGLLSYEDLVHIVQSGVLKPVQLEQINGSSIDITLGDGVLVECPGDYKVRIGDSLNMQRMPIPPEGYDLAPGEFILVQSQQEFNLPLDISSEYKLKSSNARIGLEHLNAGWCDPGWNNSVLTMELKNMTRYHHHLLKIGDKIGQMVFFRHEPVPAQFSYKRRGRYNGDRQVEGAKTDARRS